MFTAKLYAYCIPDRRDQQLFKEHAMIYYTQVSTVTCRNVPWEFGQVATLRPALLQTVARRIASSRGKLRETSRSERLRDPV